MLNNIAKRIYQNITHKENVLSFILGLALVLCYAPFSYYWLVVIILPTWLYSLQGKSSKDATKQGFIFAFGWFSAGISWVHVSIDQFGGLPLAVSLLLMVLLCLYLASFLALACYLAARFSYQKQLNLWLLLPFWLLSEFLRGVLLTGFPWLTLGYSQIDGPLATFAPIIGEKGLSALILIVSIAVVYIIKRRRVMVNIALLIAISSTYLALHNATWVSLTGKSVKVMMVQGNIKQEMKWAPELTWSSMLSYLDLTRQHYPADLIIWPESAITAVEPSKQAQDFLQIAQSSAVLNNSAIITGIIDYNINSKNYYNNLIVLGKGSADDQQGNYQYNNLNRYSKHHLLPIGEFVPFADWLRPLAPFFNLPMSSFSRGAYVQKNLIANGYHLLPLICFEVAFSEQLSANFSNQTDLLLTVSNDAWFGDSHGPHQHLDIVRMRALEFGRPFLRATNNGITAAIDHQGKIIKRIPQFEEAVLNVQIPLTTGLTPYASYNRIIDFTIPLLLLVLALMRQWFYKSRQC
ncbi:apolipoprotein N-acyltransferase [Colwellia sp. M166]|uniref:apolipoprotein N-acyltransferase n=1 Tax=Colwellia sp. M166 TaxID=2583805 RepID=UPI00211ED8E2|nr:apolipoprotein N-acyltransferase [Colwellia sp. M166]UUO24738.1 apolipoprotein N-acyltransferase [Colwellia sp. M166]|tara:strand:- start:37113 stop:38675 length:1563 start_codon:yes stop_codon:yes gene_type:complete